MTSRSVDRLTYLLENGIESLSRHIPVGEKMRLNRVIATAVIAASCGVGSAQAKSLAETDAPAEFPPSSFTGRQYVDSEGCVFVRAGIDGNVTWVPRVSRNREVVCGFQPTFANAGTAAPKPPEKTVTAAVPKTPERKAKTATAKVQPKPVKPAATAPKVVKKRPAKKVVKPAPAPGKVRKVVGRTGECPGGSALSRQYLNSDPGPYSVRCGPQTAPHVTTTGGRRGTTGVAVGRGQYVAPKHVYETQVASTDGITMPEGYKRVWMDGRLNPRRTHQTFAGKDSMDLVWTETVPRKLIVRETGRVVTRDYPGLDYPYTSYDAQRRANATISTKGKTPAKAGTTAKPKVKSTVSTRSAPAEVAERASHRYIQAGLYDGRAEAKRAAQRVARAGLPARLGKLTRGGNSYSLVLAGPFRTQAELTAAMARVRGAGFNRPVLRK